MVEGLTSLPAPDQGSACREIGSPMADHDPSTGARVARATPAAAVIIQMHTIPVTLAERPHPFPSRTRKLSSPAPKILRGQPFGKIGRRRDCCFNAVAPAIDRSCVDAAIRVRQASTRPDQAATRAHDGELAERGLSSGGMTVTGDPASPGDRQPGAPAAPVAATHARPARGGLPVSRRRRRQLAERARDPRPALRRVRARGPAHARQAALAVPRRCAHRSCATYLAAQEHAALLGDRARERARWRAEPVAGDAVHGSSSSSPTDGCSASAGRASRVGGQVGPDRADGRRVPAPDRRADDRRRRRRSGRRPSVVGRRAPVAVPGATPSPAASASASAAPSATPRADAQADERTRTASATRVKAGDTLSAIAVKFGTTLKVLKRINDITDPTLIRPGQVILVPCALRRLRSRAARLSAGSPGSTRSRTRRR